MSRIGKTIRQIPKDVTIEVKKDFLVVKGPRGELKQKLHPAVSVVIKDDQASVEVKNQGETRQRALWGTFSSILGNMIEGVSNGFKKQLEINGVGYKVNMKGKDLALELGFSHPVEVKSKPDINFSVEKNVITIEGIDKQLVGEIAANIRKLRKPEPYKGKGIKYVGEIIRRKAGKTAGKGE
ncbi:MAG: 50S ribosomal protein L6 [bacterium]